MGLDEKLALLDKLEKEYLDKFGSDSLDRAVCYAYGPPSNNDDVEKTIDDIISELQKAIKINKRIDQYDKEFFDKVKW